MDRPHLEAIRRCDKHQAPIWFPKSRGCPECLEQLNNESSAGWLAREHRRVFEEIDRALFGHMTDGNGAA